MEKERDEDEEEERRVKRFLARRGLTTTSIVKEDSTLAKERIGVRERGGSPDKKKKKDKKKVTSSNTGGQPSSSSSGSNTGPPGGANPPDKQPPPPPPSGGGGGGDEGGGGGRQNRNHREEEEEIPSSSESESRASSRAASDSGGNEKEKRHSKESKKCREIQDRYFEPNGAMKEIYTQVSQLGVNTSFREPIGQLCSRVEAGLIVGNQSRTLANFGEGKTCGKVHARPTAPTLFKTDLPESLIPEDVTRVLGIRIGKESTAAGTRAPVFRFKSMKPNGEVLRATTVRQYTSFFPEIETHMPRREVPDDEKWYEETKKWNRLLNLMLASTSALLMKDAMTQLVLNMDIMALMMEEIEKILTYRRNEDENVAHLLDDEQYHAISREERRKLRDRTHSQRMTPQRHHSPSNVLSPIPSTDSERGSGGGMEDQRSYKTTAVLQRATDPPTTYPPPTAMGQIPLANPQQQMMYPFMYPYPPMTQLPYPFSADFQHQQFFRAPPPDQHFDPSHSPRGRSRDRGNNRSKNSSPSHFSPYKGGRKGGR
jgi:hypothetical protein